MTCDCTRTGKSGLHHTGTLLLLSFDRGGVESLNRLVLFAVVFLGHHFCYLYMATC